MLVDQFSMRPMPPNATQMTSMITMQQPVHATTTAATTTAVAPATITTSGTGTGSGPAGKPQATTSLKQQQQQQVVNVGGQRTALKLSSRPPAHLQQQADQQQQQQQQQQQAQQWHQPGAARPQARQQSGYVPESPSLMTSTGTGTSGPGGVPAPAVVGQHRLQQANCANPAALECSAISGLTTTTTNTSTSQATGVHERPDLDPADEDPSECSCSNSFDCSLDEPTHSTSSHLEEPLLGGGGGGPGQQMMNHYPHAAHHHHHHQHRPLQAHQQQHHHDHHHHHQQQQHHRSHHHDFYNQHHRQQHHQPQNFQPIQQHPQHAQYHKARDLGRPSGHHYHPTPGPGPGPPLYVGAHNNQQMQQQHQPQHQPSLPSSANDHHSQHRHRPLVPHASMPPVLPSVARTYMSQSPPPPQPPPAPLMRHSTYVATSDTITDESLQHQPRHQHQHQHNQAYRPQSNNGPPQQPVSPPLSPSAGGHPAQHHATGYHYPGANHSSFNETELLVGKRSQQAKREISFRRSATTREDDVNRWHRGAPQEYSYGDAMATRTLPLERQQSGNGSGIAGGNSSLQRSNHQRSTPRLNNQSGPPSGQKISQRRYQQQHDMTSNFDNGQQQQQNTPITAPPILTSGRAQSASLGPGSEAQGAAASAAGSVPGNLLLGANSSIVMPHSVSPFEAAATFCPPMMVPPPPLPPVGPLAVTTHRTNSPWMRLSSIILTPVGIVIVLFIVVSPLLHYLM